MRYIRLAIWTLLSVVLLSPVIAVMQAEVCRDIVQAALDRTDEVCDGTGRNRACYGHDMLNAEPHPGFEEFKFEKAGDTVAVGQINSLRLSPMDVEAGTWGVALMEVQADIPDDKPQNVSVLLFGDVKVNNLIADPILMDATVIATGNANVRKEPSEDAFVMATIPAETTITARGRSEDNEWIYIDVPNQNSKHGWVASSLLDLSGSISTLHVIEPGMTQYGPMQAFYLSSGPNQTTCEEAPNDGLLVQTPDGIAEIRLWINEVKIRLGSTAFIQAQPGNRMTIQTLEGEAHVEALGVEQVAVAGTGVTVQLNQESQAAAPPSRPQVYESQDVQNLPVQNLERPIDPVTLQATASPTSVPPTDAPPTNTPVPPTATWTNTPVPPTATSTNTTVPPTATPTNTSVPPTNTPVPPTSTSIPPTETPVPPTSTSIPPTETPIPPPPTSPSSTEEVVSRQPVTVSSSPPVVEGGAAEPTFDTIIVETSQ
jgi:hypothetical protein